MIGSNCIEAKRQFLRFSTKDCPRCGAPLVHQMIDINLVESRCSCGYIVRDREGSIADAEAVRREADERYGQVIVTRIAS